MALSEFDREILIHGYDDVIQLAEMVSVAHFDLGISFGDDMYVAVAECIRSLLVDGLAEIGDLVPDGPTLLFERWAMAPSEVVDTVLSKWKALGRDPNLGEVSWLALTEKGSSVASPLYEEARRVLEEE